MDFLKNNARRREGAAGKLYQHQIFLAYRASLFQDDYTEQLPLAPMTSFDGVH